MPTYEYVCTDCANEWEAEQSIKEDALKECPKCHHATAKRQISRGTGFILKGGGWYSDLYSGGSNTKGSTTSTASSSDSSSSGSGSSGTGGGSSGSGSSDAGSSGGSSSGGSTGGSGGASTSAA